MNSFWNIFCDFVSDVISMFTETLRDLVPALISAIIIWIFAIIMAISTGYICYKIDEFVKNSNKTENSQTLLLEKE